MTTWKRLCAVAALTCLLAVAARPGDMSAGVTGNPTPTPTPQPASLTEPDKLPDAETVPNPDAPVIEAVLALLQSLFMAF